MHQYLFNAVYLLKITHYFALLVIQVIIIVQHEANSKDYLNKVRFLPKLYLLATHPRNKKVEVFRIDLLHPHQE